MQDPAIVRVGRHVCGWVAAKFCRATVAACQFADRFGAELRQLVAGDRVLERAATIGSVNQFLDSTPVGDDLDMLRRLKGLYE